MITMDKLSQKGLSIVFWNVRSLVNKVDSVRESIRAAKPDLVCITETWLHAGTPDSLFSIPEYSFNRADRLVLTAEGRTKKGGGIGIYIHEKVNVVRIDSEVHSLSNENVESVTLNIKLPHTRPIFVICLYRPPQGCIETMLKSLKSLISNLPPSNDREIIVGGDFNIDYSKPRNRNTQKLKKLLKELSLEQIIQSHTRLDKVNSTIDLIATNCPHVLDSGLLSWNISDHTPVYIVRKKKKIKLHRTKCEFQGRSYRNLNEVIFRQDLLMAHWDQFHEASTVDEAWDFLYRTVIKILDPHCPMKLFRFSNTKPPWMSQETMELIKDRDRALAIATRSRRAEDIQYARTARNLVNVLVRDARADYIKEQLVLNESEPQKFWRVIRDIIPNKRSLFCSNLKDHTGNHVKEQQYLLFPDWLRAC